MASTADARPTPDLSRILTWERLRRVSVRVLVAVVVVWTVLVVTAGPADAQTPADDDGTVTDTPIEGTAVDGTVEPADGDEFDGLAEQLGEELFGRQVDEDPLIEVPEVPEVPDVGISINSEGEGLSQTVAIILLLTVGSVAPSLLLMATSFTRFAIVLALTRNALGTQQVPPTQVLTGLALFLTFFVMAPILSEINDEALQPLLNGEISQGEAFDAGFAPLQEFMAAQTSDDDLRLFLELRGNVEATSVEEVPASVLIPAFVMSELRTAFTIGFVIFVPFLVIDIVVSSVLMSMGMVMLPPVFISLPLKLLLFVLVDGWALIVHSLVSSVNLT